MCDLLSDRNRDQIEAALVSGTLPQDSHSIALDMEYAEDMIGVEAGSVIKLSIGDQEIPVTVSGLFLNDGLQNGHGPLALDNTCMVATKELFQEAMPMIDCFDYSWSIVSDPQKAEQIENSLSAILSSDPDLALDTIGIHKDYEEMGKPGRFWRASGTVLAGIPLWRGQSHQHHPLQSDVQKAGKQCLSCHWSDQKTALSNDHL